jgi:hypothetical protein
MRDHRDELWRRWADALGEDAGSDYRELIASPLGERILRGLIDDVIAYSEAEEYERPVLLRRMEERATAETGHRLALGFSIRDMVTGLHVLRGVIVDLLIDALVLDETPSFADTLDQFKEVSAYLDRVVCATMEAA